jgi:hypothetical protein
MLLRNNKHGRSEHLMKESHADPFTVVKFVLLQAQNRKIIISRGKRRTK